MLDGQVCVNGSRTVFVFLFLWLGASFCAVAEPLTFSYFERPPYYSTTEAGQAEGVLIERVRQILPAAGLSGRFVGLTPYRILYVLRHAATPHCSIGWFKTAERQLFAKFSEPIYRDRSLVLVTSRTQQGKFSGKQTLREVFSDQNLTMARLAEFSYGDQVDKLLGALTPQSILLTGQQGAVLQAVIDQKASYMLVAPEEVDLLAESIGVTVEDVVTLKMTDMVAGNLRYLMCNQAVPDQTMDKINQAILQLYRQWNYVKH